MSSIVDPIKAPLQFRILQFIIENCCMSASTSVIGRDLGFERRTWGSINTAIRGLRDKGMVSENKGRLHYYECENY